MLDLKNPITQRAAMQAFFFGYQAFTAKADEMLARRGLSRVHQRIVFFIAHSPRRQRQRAADLARREQAGTEHTLAPIDRHESGAQRCA
jgi:hypothetical protein